VLLAWAGRLRTLWKKRGGNRSKEDADAGEGKNWPNDRLDSEVWLAAAAVNQQQARCR